MENGHGDDNHDDDDNGHSDGEAGGDGGVRNVHDRDGDGDDGGVGRNQELNHVDVVGIGELPYRLGPTCCLAVVLQALENAKDCEHHSPNDCTWLRPD